MRPSRLRLTRPPPALLRRGPISWLDERLGASALAWMMGGAVGTAALVCIGILLRGTSPAAAGAVYVMVLVPAVVLPTPAAPPALVMVPPESVQT